MDFEWNLLKDRTNRRKHRVGFDEALTVFADPLARIFGDPDHSAEEARELIIGHSSRERLLIVSFTENKGRVRIISARLATTAERREYEQNTSKS
ncbi:MAG: BrnT family toxin [Acidobacteriia bacterium]|nr:BrnT family toxin [Terriglobia bacterium]